MKQETRPQKDPTKIKREQQAELQAELQRHIQTSAKSQNQIAKALGISSAALSQWLSVQYAGDNAAIEAKVAKYIKREAKRQQSLQIPTVRTTNYKRIETALALAHEDCEIAVITGAAGSGKTTAIAAYAKANNCLLLRAHRGLTMHRLMADIADLLGLEKVRGLANSCEAIIEKLRHLDTAIIIDEAEYLSDNSLELLRQVIYDSAQSPLVLVGLPRLAGLIRNMRNDHEQLLSRVGIALQLEPTPLADVEKVIKAAWAELPQSVIKRIYDYSQNRSKMGSSPSLRSAAKLLLRLHRLCGKTMQKPTATLIDEVAALIMQKTQL